MPVISYDQSVSPHAPRVWLRITDNFNRLRFQSFAALVDSGAHYTCIPQSVADRTPGYNYEEDYAEEFTGNHVRVRLVRILEATVEFLDNGGNVLLKNSYANLRLPIVRAEGLLGRDILNRHLCVLDAPNFAGKVI